MADSKKNAGGRERNSAVFKYSGNKIVKAIYKYNSTLPETDSYYSDTLRTDNLTGYYDSLRYDVNNNLTEIYHKYNFGGTPGTAYTFKIKYPGGSDSTFIIDQTSATNGLEYRISGKISNQANPYKPYFSLFFHYFNYVDYQVLVPDPLRRNSYVCEYLLPLLPNAISTFKVEWFIGTSSFEQGNYKYIMSADSLNLRMNNPASVVNNYRKINYLYKKVHR